VHVRRRRYVCVEGWVVGWWMRLGPHLRARLLRVAAGLRLHRRVARPRTLLAHVGAGLMALCAAHAPLLSPGDARGGRVAARGRLHHVLVAGATTRCVLGCADWLIDALAVARVHHLTERALVAAGEGHVAIAAALVRRGGAGWWRWRRRRSGIDASRIVHAVSLAREPSVAARSRLHDALPFPRTLLEGFSAHGLRDTPARAVAISLELGLASAQLHWCRPPTVQ
jgi:hypothetical protein